MKKIKIIIAGVLLLASLVGCTTKKEVVLNLEDIYANLLENREELLIPGSATLSADEFSALYGVDSELLEEVVVSRAMMSAHLCDIILIKTTPGETKNVLSSIEAFYEGELLYPFMQDYVENMQVIEEGNYLIVIVAEQAEAIRQQIEEEIK